MRRNGRKGKGPLAGPGGSEQELDGDAGGQQGQGDVQLLLNLLELAGGLAVGGEDLSLGVALGDLHGVNPVVDVHAVDLSPACLYCSACGGARRILSHSVTSGILIGRGRRISGPYIRNPDRSRSDHQHSLW